MFFVVFPLKGYKERKGREENEGKEKGERGGAVVFVLTDITRFFCVVCVGGVFLICLFFSSLGSS